MFIFPLYTDYRIPDLIADIALQSPSEPYEIIQRRLGLRDKSAPYEPFMNVYDYKKGNCLRYSYCTEDFILGTVMRPPLPWDAWILGSAQSWHHGLLIKRGSANERVVPICVQKRDTIAEQWSVQSKGTLICQKLPDAKGAEQMAVFVSDGLADHTERDEDHLFIDAGTVYCSVRFVGAGYLEGKNLPKNGQWYVGNDESAPVILEAVQSDSFTSFEAFKQLIKGRTLNFTKSILRYKSMYNEEVTFYADQSAVPTINGMDINYHPDKLFNSKYIQSDWDSGAVYVEKEGKQLLLAFN